MPHEGLFWCCHNQFPLPNSQIIKEMSCFHEPSYQQEVGANELPSFPNSFCSIFSSPSSRFEVFQSEKKSVFQYTFWSVGTILVSALISTLIL